MTTARSGVVAGVLAAFAVTIGAATTGEAATRVHGRLAPTAHAPKKARGQAVLRLKSASTGRLKVVAQKLAANATFDVVADGVKVGEIHTNAAGNGKAQLSTAPHGRAGFLGFDPRGAALSVRDQNGDDELEGDVPDNGDANVVACCVTDHEGEVECDDKTTDECTAAGGVVAPVPSCLPDPCGGVVPPGGGDAVTCCLTDSAAGAFVDDDPEVECKRITSVDCAAAGGTVIDAPSCEEHACKPVPPPDVVVCCTAQDDDNGEMECELRTPEHCSEHHGTVSTATSCEPNPCGGTPGGDGEQGGGEN